MWTGALSIESCNGELWRAARRSYDHIVQELPPLSQLETLFLTLDIGDSSPSVIDSPAIAKHVIQCYLSYLFDEVEQHDVDILDRAAWTLRYEIAMRGKGDDALKCRANAIVQRLLGQSRYSVPTHVKQWEDRTAFSAILQPFLISPSINYIDIIISLWSLCPNIDEKCEEWSSSSYEESKDAISAHILEAIRLEHPFPVLERCNETVQYYLSLDTFYPEKTFDATAWGVDHKHPADLLTFGLGPRRCPGRPIAMASLPALIYKLAMMKKKGRTVDPQRNHLYSGRQFDNTNNSLREVLHATSRIGGCMWNLMTAPRLKEYN